MPRQREVRVLVATDGSRHAQAAIATTVHFPWPDRTRVRAISARRTRAELQALDSVDCARSWRRDGGRRARRTLSRRWPDVEVEVLDTTPVEGILGEAERFRADVIVVGWRGLGAVRRLLTGSVSRGIVRGSKCTVLVVEQSKRVREIVVGFDRISTRQARPGLCRPAAAASEWTCDTCQRHRVDDGPLAEPLPWCRGGCA